MKLYLVILKCNLNNNTNNTFYKCLFLSDGNQKT